MTPEYEFYHGALLHQLVTSVGRELRIATHDIHGRPDAYIIDGDVGIMIKHSTARITPWSFTFSKEHVTELHSLRAATRVCFVCFVCGDDGFVCIRDSEFVRILTPTESDVASIRVERRQRKMYRVSSSGNSLEGKVAKGVHDVVSEFAHTQRNVAVA